MNTTPEPVRSLPDWTNNRFVITAGTAFASAFFTLLVSYWVFSGRLASIEHQLSSKADNTALQTLNTEVVRLTDKTAKLDDLRVVSERLSAENLQLAQKAADHIDEIVTLQNKVNQLEVNSAQHLQAINDAVPRIGTLEDKLGTMREHVAKLEGEHQVKSQ